MAEPLFIRRLRDEAALSNTFDKGLKLAQKHKVLKCEGTAGSLGNIVDVSGIVEGSYESSYRVGATLNFDGCEIVDYRCGCPASHSYAGMCKHEIALALRYLNDAGVVALPARGDEPVWGAAAAGAATAAAAAARVSQMPTDSKVFELMDALDAERAVGALRAKRLRGAGRIEAAEPVDLELTLLPAKDSYYVSTSSWCIKLKVRRGNSAYVVMNVARLVEAWKTGDELNFGKSARAISFACVPASFTERARRLLTLVERIVDSQQALFKSRWRYQESGRGTEIKALPVAPADIVQILDALQGASIDFEEAPIYRYGHAAKTPKRTLAVGVGDPELPAALVPQPEGGYLLALPADAYCFAAGQDMYVVSGGEILRCSEDFVKRSAGLLQRMLPMRENLYIAARDLPDFCRSLLPALRAATDLEAPESLDELVPPEAEFRFWVGLEDGEVFCDAHVCYDDWEASLYEPVASGQPSRDAVAEVQAQDVAEAYFPLRDGRLAFDESDDELLYVLLTEGLAELGAVGEVYLSDRLRAVAVRDAPSLSVTATVKSDLLDVKVDMSGLADAELVSYLASYKSRQKFVRLSNGDFLRMDESAQALDDLSEGLGVSVEDLVRGVDALPQNRTLFVDALLKRREGMRLHRNAAFKQIVRDFDTFADADSEVPAGLEGTLRSYQVAGFRWLEMLGRFGFGGILADDMGLGKTLQMIAHLLARKEREEGAGAPSLVVCPASLVYNWMAELERFAPSLSAVAVLGQKRERLELVGKADEVDVFVTSYDLMKRDVEFLSQRSFGVLVLDEAQYIKNPATKAAKAAKCLQSQERFALTGTPIENRLGELWSIFDFLMPGILGSRESFAKRFEGPVERGEFSASNRLQCMVAPFVLRRLKADVLTDLPEKDESVVYTRLSGEQDKLYRAAQDLLARQVGKQLSAEFKKKKLQVLAELTKLRQICCDPHLAYDNYEGDSAKLATCMELVSNAVEAGHRVLLFSQFTSMLDIIAERFRAEGLEYLMLTGATGKEARKRMVDEFQLGEVPVFLISLKAGGVGLNLTAADVVIHYDPWWNLAAQNQATDRAHRIGQQKNVSVFKLIAQDTIEERILKMQESKRDLAENVLGGRDISTTELSREDILLLLGNTD